ncbi:hypothetical protein Tco_1484047 [Tanacetum coccineum]
MITVSYEPGLFTMADVKVNAPEVPSTADAPPTRSDEQILPRDKWVPILWGIVNRTDIYYTERIWEEFTRCIHSFIEDKMNLTIHAEGKKKVNPLVIPGYALGYLKFSFKNTKRVRFGMKIPNTLITEDIRTASYYPEYVAKVAKYQWFLAGEEVSDDDAPPPKPLRDEFTDEGVPATEPRVDDEEAIMQKVLEESMKDAYPAYRGPLPPVVFREPDFRKLQSLPEVQGKGKEKFIFQRHTPATAEPSGLIESSSLYAELGLTDNGTESDEEVSPEMNAQGQEEGQGGINPGDAGVS